MIKPNAQDVKIWKTLNDYGRPMHLAELATATSVQQRDVQKALHRLVCAGYMIGSNSQRGIFVILNELDWQKGLWDLDSKASELRARRDGLAEAGRKVGWKEPTAPPEFNFEGGKAA